MENIKEHIYSACKITDINDKDRTFVITASDETVDRYKEVMRIAGCKYKLPIPILWSHNRKDDLPPIGRTVWIKRLKGPKQLKAKIEFAPTEMAQGIAKLYTDNWMDDFSIGFLPHKDGEPTKEEKKKGATRAIEEWELVEISAVPIGANPNAKLDREKRVRLKEAIDNGDIQLPEMVYKDFGFKEGEIAKDATLIDADTKEEIKLEEKAIEEKPYENEHACRLNDPSKYTQFRRKNCEQKHDGKCVDVIYGRKKDGKSEIQSLRYPKDKWTESAAKSHCKSREGMFEAAKKEAKAEKFNCECIECGHKLESEKHCKDIKCPECGGKMRRVERPGPGRDIDGGITSEEIIKFAEFMQEHSIVSIPIEEWIKKGENTNKFIEWLEKDLFKDDYVKIIKPEQKVIILKDSPQEQGLESEKLDQDEAKKIVKEMVIESFKELGDRLVRDFRRKILGIVDE